MMQAGNGTLCFTLPSSNKEAASKGLFDFFIPNSKYQDIQMYPLDEIMKTKFLLNLDIAHQPGPQLILPFLLQIFLVIK